MTDPFPGFLLESRVIIDETQVSNALSSFIDDNSRLEKKIGKRIRHALEDIVGLKQAAFIDLLTLHDKISCAKKMLKALLEIACKPSNSRLQIPTRVACNARTHVMMLHSDFCTVWLSQNGCEPIRITSASVEGTLVKHQKQQGIKQISLTRRFHFFSLQT